MASNIFYIIAPTPPAHASTPVTGGSKSQGEGDVSPTLTGSDPNAQGGQANSTLESSASSGNSTRSFQRQDAIEEDFDVINMDVDDTQVEPVPNQTAMENMLQRMKELEDTIKATMLKN